MSAPTRFRKLWLWPIVLAALTALGLGSALMGDGPWDALSWLTLAAPVLAAVSLFRRSPPQQKRSAAAPTEQSRIRE